MEVNNGRRGEGRCGRLGGEVWVKPRWGERRPTRGSYGGARVTVRCRGARGGWRCWMLVEVTTTRDDYGKKIERGRETEGVSRRERLIGGERRVV